MAKNDKYNWLGGVLLFLIAPIIWIALINLLPEKEKTVFWVGLSLVVIIDFILLMRKIFK